MRPQEAAIKRSIKNILISKKKKKKKINLQGSGVFLNTSTIHQ